MIMASNFPMGIRFVPTDEELIVDYLLKKIQSQPIPVDGISAVNIYNYNPQTLSEKYPRLGDHEWYFFTPRVRKYPNGTRPNRAAGTGYWKATGSDKRILFENKLVGFKTALVFYQGEPKKGGKKTDWLMHEYRVDRPPRTKTSADDMRLDDWVLCKVYKTVVRRKAKDNNNRDLQISNIEEVVVNRVYKKARKAKDNNREGNEQVVDQNDQVDEEVGDSTSDHGNDQGCIVDTATPVVDENVNEEERCYWYGHIRDPLLSPYNIWLREMSSSSTINDDDDAFCAIDQWPEFFVGGNWQMQSNGDGSSCASSQVSSFVPPPPTPSDASTSVDDHGGCDLYELIMGGRKR